MKRDTVVNVFLIIVGILLALALFGAGAVWKGRMKPNRPFASAPAAEKDRSLARKKLNSEESMPESENVASARPDCEPLAPAQGLIRKKPEIADRSKTAFFAARTANCREPIVTGAPIWCPNRQFRSSLSTQRSQSEAVRSHLFQPAW